MTRRMTRWVILAATLALVAAGCDSGGGGGSIAEFCRIAQQLDDQEGEPSASQIDQVVDAAPGEIKDDVRTLAEAFERVGDDPEAAAELFSDENVIEAGTRVEEFQEENCEDGDEGAGEGDNGGDDAAADDADAADTDGGEGDVERFCEIANSDAEPDAETLSEWITTAPGEIAFDVGVVIDSILAEQNDTEPSFDEEQLTESTTNVDEFISANC